MKIVAFVPIKLNSERLKNKNLLLIGDKPLCWYICDTLRRVKTIDEVYVYCSDEKIKNYIPEGVAYKQRSKRLDGNLVKGMDIYKSFISEVDADIYVLAHATSPFIRRDSIENALSRVVSGKNDSAMSVRRIQTFAWYDGRILNYDKRDIPRTQDIQPVWVETSGFYIFRKGIMNETGSRIGDRPFFQEVEGMEAIDIDEEQDYELACLYYEMKGFKE